MVMLTETLKYSTAANWNGRLLLDPNITDAMYAQIQKRFDAGIEAYYSGDYNPTIVGSNEVALRGGEIRVRLLPNGVGCNCRDMQVRLLPCKHTIIGAIVLGENDPMFADVRAVAVAEVDENAVHTAEVIAKVKKSGKQPPQHVRLGQYWLLSDLLYNRQAIEFGVPNALEDLHGLEFKGMVGLVEHLLDPIAQQFGRVSLTNGYNSPDLWWAKYGDRKVTNDLHSFRLKPGLVGGAVDILVHGHDPAEVMRWVMAHCEYDRLIHWPERESGVICVAWTNRPRRHAKQWRSGKYVNFK
jgi:hypothetical protein